MLVAGVDTHKDTHHIAFLDPVGKLLCSFEIRADADGYAKAIDRAKAVGIERWGLEGTGSYGRAFAQTLVAAQYTVYEVPGVVTKRHRKNSTRKGKSDALDAQAIAEAVLRESERLPQFAVYTEQAALRRRYDQRDRLVRERTMVINRLRSNVLQLGLKEVFPELLSDTAATTLRKLLQKRQARDLIDEALLDETLFEYFEKKVGEGKTRRSALRALKRRLATVVFYRLREAFERITPAQFCAAAA